MSLRRTIRRTLLGLVAFLVSFGVASGILFWNRIVRDLPEDLDLFTEWIPPSATTVLDRHGEPIDVFYREKRFWVSLDELPPHVAQAFVAAEDDRFWEHRGVDLPSIARAAVANWRAGRTVQGGSTITQQVVKNVLLSPERSYTRKLKEAVLAVRLEREVSKQTLLELYLNLIPLGSGTYGVEAAAREYFGVSARDLDVGQAALLAGLTPAPSRYSPHRSRTRAAERRSLVLERMVAEGVIDEEQRARFETAPVLGSIPQGPHRDDAAFVTAVRREARRLFGSERARTRGLTLHTGFDPAIQAAARRAIRDAVFSHLERQGPAPLPPGEREPVGPPAPWAQGAAVVLENRTGRVLALVGGLEDRLEGFVRATQARRQPGSAFKPIVFATALAHGRPADSRVLVGPLALPGGSHGPWVPRDHVGAGRLPLRRALALSSNTASVRLLFEAGQDEVVSLAHDLGVSTPLRHDATLALGSSEVTPMDLARAYGTFARMGRRMDPVFITEVEDHDGASRARAGDTVSVDGLELTLPGGPGERVLPSGVAYEVVDLLQAVVEEGTGRRARSAVQARGGKTGTTNDAADTWFVGITPRHTVAVWIGSDELRPLGPGEGGSRTALPAWNAIVEALEVRHEEFLIPVGAVVERTRSGLSVARRPAPDPKAFVELGDAPLPPFAEVLPRLP